MAFNVIASRNSHGCLTTYHIGTNTTITAAGFLMERLCCARALRKVASLYMLQAFDVVSKGLTIATGMSGHGFGISPRIVRMIVSLVESRQSNYPAYPFV